MKVCSLFTGGGLGDYGLELAGMEVVFQCEIDSYCQKVLKLRWPDVPKHEDIKTLGADKIPECDIIVGGFPCQPFSVAGKQEGKKDDRYLWPEMLRIIKQVKPAWILGENVPGIIGNGIDEILHDLEAESYAWLPLVFPAHAVGANHRRNRVWIVGYSKHHGLLASEKPGAMQKSKKQKRKIKSLQSKGAGCVSRDAADTIGKGRKNIQGKRSTAKASRRGRSRPGNWWYAEPGICRVDDGVANRVDRLKCLGNGQVTFVVKWIGERIIDFERSRK